MYQIARSPLNIQITVEGKPLPIYTRQDGAFFVEALPGKEFIIEVYNSGFSRVEVLASVDGLNTLEKEEANWEKPGMVIPGYQTWKNRGWRLSDKEVSTFKFEEDKSKSVASKVGKTKNTGIIGLALFREKSFFTLDSPFFPNPYAPYSSTGSPLIGGVQINTRGVGGSSGYTKSSSSYHVNESSEEITSRGINISAPDVATGAGEIVKDKIGTTSWQRASVTPDFVIQIQYRTRQTLVEMGLISEEPVAFVNLQDDHATGYANLLK